MTIDGITLTEADVTEICRLRIRRMSSAEIGLQFKITEESVAKLTKYIPVEYLRSSHSQNPERDKAIRSIRRTGVTLEEIGQRFKMTRERVRQITRDITLQPKATPQPKAIKFPIPGFRNKMSHWLWAAGYKKCPICKIWQSGITGRVNHSTKCRPCAATQQREIKIRKRKIVEMELADRIRKLREELARRFG
jgi:hypothetical protein